MKTIDIQGKEWFDRTYGNSYFSAIATLNYRQDNELVVKIPFTYGYGDQYIFEALTALGFNLHKTSLYEIRKEYIVRANIERRCLKREVLKLTK